MRWAAITIVLSACGRIGFDAQSAPDAGIVPAAIAHYRFDDDPTDGVDDSSGRGHDGTCAACPALGPGVDGAGYHFSASELIRVPYGPDFDPTVGVSVAVWIRPDGEGCLVGKLFGTGVENSWQLCVSPQLDLFGCGPSMCSGTSPKLPQGAWRQGVLVVDPAHMRGWIGGQLAFDLPVTVPNDMGEIVIGGDLDSGAPVALFAGDLDDVRIWNLALTPEQVAAIVAP